MASSTRHTCSRRWIIQLTCLVYASHAGCMEHHVLHDVPDPFVINSPARAAPAPVPTTPGVPERIPETRRTVTVVVDAGHGGKDPGAQAHGLAEKEVNLSIAMRLAQILRARGVTVATTRDSDVFIPLNDRAAMADNVSADVLVSIHADAAERLEASGTTVFISRNATTESRAIAERINASFVGSGIESRGVKTAGFRVLVAHSRPAVLVECGFLTNTYDASRLGRAEYRQRMAQLVADALTGHFGL